MTSGDQGEHHTETPDPSSPSAAWSNLHEEGSRRMVHHLDPSISQCALIRVLSSLCCRFHLVWLGHFSLYLKNALAFLICQLRA